MGEQRAGRVGSLQTTDAGEEKMAEEIGFQTELKIPFQEAIKRVTAALRKEGFGVLTQVDMKTTFKDRLNADFRHFVILGACHPPLAYRALAANSDAGLLLPYNVTVHEEGDHVRVTAVNPAAILSLLEGDTTAKAVGIEAKEKLERVIKSLAI
jgi:uncharacterized protein (DUF302 family)